MPKSQDFFSDKRVLEAKRLILEALAEHQKGMNALKPSESEKAKADYKALLEKLGDERGGKPFFDYLGSGFGAGPFAEMADGSTKYDFISGIGVHYFGHSHPGVTNAMVTGALSNTVMQGNLQQNVDTEKLLDLLLTEANRYGAGFHHCFLTSSGVMANENACKMAFNKKQPAHRIMAFKKCFHGRTMAIAHITDKAAYRDGVPKTLDVDYVPFYDSQNHDQSIANTLSAMEKIFAEYPGKHAIFIAEMIQGEAGSWPGHKEFFNKVFSLAKKHNLAIIADEVQTFGRTEKLFAFQTYEMDKMIDFVNIGKNSQVCATLYRGEFSPPAGLVSQTFTSSTTAINASYYIIKSIVDGDYLGPKGKIQRIHNYFVEKLKNLHKKYPDKIEGPFGIGAMIAMTLFGGDADKSKQFTKKLFENGVTSFTAGAQPTRVRFLLPMGAIEQSHIDQVSQIIEATLNEVK